MQAAQMTSGGEKLDVLFTHSLGYPFDIFLRNEKIVAVGKVPDLAAGFQRVANRTQIVELQHLLRALDCRIMLHVVGNHETVDILQPRIVEDFLVRGAPPEPAAVGL